MNATLPSTRSRLEPRPKPSLGRKIFNFAAFQLSWFACVLGGARELPWLGPVVVLVFLVVHLVWEPRRAREISVILVAGLVGTVADSAQTAAGILEFPDTHLVPGWIPLWMVSLWLIFGSTLRTSLGWLQHSPWLASLFGAIGGPLAYFGGESLGATQLHPNRVLAAASIAAVYAVVTPLLCLLARQLDSTRRGGES